MRKDRPDNVLGQADLGPAILEAIEAHEKFLADEEIRPMLKLQKGEIGWQEFRDFLREVGMRGMRGPT